MVDDKEQAASPTSLTFATGYRDVPISKPGGTRTAGDASVGDLDGDGTYESGLKWDPADSAHR